MLLNSSDVTSQMEINVGQIQFEDLKFLVKVNHFLLFYIYMIEYIPFI